MGTLRRALAWEDEQRPGAALQVVFGLVLSGLIAVVALAFGLVFLSGTVADATADDRIAGWILLAMAVGLPVGTVVLLRRRAQRWQAAHGEAVPTAPLRWRPALWARAVGLVVMVGALSLVVGDHLRASIAFAIAGAAGVFLVVVAGRRWTSRSTRSRDHRPEEQS